MRLFLCAVLLTLLRAPEALAQIRQLDAPRIQVCNAEAKPMPRCAENKGAFALLDGSYLALARKLVQLNSLSTESSIQALFGAVPTSAVDLGSASLNGKPISLRSLTWSLGSNSSVATDSEVLVAFANNTLMNIKLMGKDTISLHIYYAGLECDPNCAGKLVPLGKAAK